MSGQTERKTVEEILDELREALVWEASHCIDTYEENLVSELDIFENVRNFSMSVGCEASDPGDEVAKLLITCSDSDAHALIKHLRDQVRVHGDIIQFSISGVFQEWPEKKGDT